MKGISSLAGGASGADDRAERGTPVWRSGHPHVADGERRDEGHVVPVGMRHASEGHAA